MSAMPTLDSHAVGRCHVEEGLPVDVLDLGLGAFLHPNAVAMATIVKHVKHEGLIVLGIGLLSIIWCYTTFIHRKRTQEK
jgi:hypothetical protein